MALGYKIKREVDGRERGGNIVRHAFAHQKIVGGDGRGGLDSVYVSYHSFRH